MHGLHCGLDASVHLTVANTDTASKGIATSAGSIHFTMLEFTSIHLSRTMNSGCMYGTDLNAHHRYVYAACILQEG